MVLKAFFLNNNMKKIALLTAVFLLKLGSIYSQSAEEALLHFQENFSGTARVSAMSGSYSALGGDYGGLSINPAGVGSFIKDNLGFTLGLNFNKSQSTYLGTEVNDGKTSFNLYSASMLWQKTPSKKRQAKGWMSTGFGIGYNRQANYHSHIQYAGYNDENSLTDWFAQNAQGTPESELADDELSPHLYDSYLAYWSYLINPDTTDANSYHSVMNNGGITQGETIDIKGGKGDLSVTYGADYKGKIHLGASLNLPIINQTTKSSFTEEDKDDHIGKFNEFTYHKYIHTEGTGIQAKLGIIALPKEYLRFSFAFHSPASVRFTDHYTFEIQSTAWGPQGIQDFTATSPDGNFEYKLVTPMKAVLGVGYRYKKLGYVTVDYEFTDFSQMRYNFGQYIEAEETVNRQINDNYGVMHTLKGGLEVKLMDHFFLRGGMQYHTDYEKDSAVDASGFGYSAGIGFVFDHLQFDFAMLNSGKKFGLTPYTLSSEQVPMVDVKLRNTQAMLTVGFIF